MDEQLLREFDEAMFAGYIRGIKEAGYNASYFRQMMEAKGGLRTAQFLLGSDQPASGFATLYDLQRLDLSVEALVLIPRFSVLFTPEELKTARDRLAEVGYSHDPRWDSET